MSVLVITGLEHLGDVLFGTGPLALLHEARPDLRVVLLTSPISGQITETDPAVAVTVPVAHRRGLFTGRRYVARAVLALERACAGLGVEVGGARFVALSRSEVYRAVARRARAGFMLKDVVGAGSYGHRTVRIAKALQPFGVSPPSAPIGYRVHTGLSDDALAQELLARLGVDPGQRFAIVHPGSRETRLFGRRRGTAREWGGERFGELARALTMMGLFVLVSGYGRAERWLATDVARAVREGVRVLPEVPARVLAALLRRASVVVGNDSGPLHLAAAVGTRCIGLYGPTDPDETGPVAVAGRSVVLGPELPGPCEVATPLVVQAVRRALESG